MRAKLHSFAVMLSILVAVWCAAVQLATYVSYVNLTFALPPLGLLLVACLALLTKGNPFLRLRMPARPWLWFDIALAAYAIVISVAYLIYADGASRVAQVDGHYVAMYKGQVLRTITEAEFRAMPNWWTRVTSVWVAVGAMLQATVVSERR